MKKRLAQKVLQHPERYSAHHFFRALSRIQPVLVDLPELVKDTNELWDEVDREWGTLNFFRDSVRSMTAVQVAGKVLGTVQALDRSIRVFPSERGLAMGRRAFVWSLMRADESAIWWAPGLSEESDELFLNWWVEAGRQW